MIFRLFLKSLVHLFIKNLIHSRKINLIFIANPYS
jgi:hypothetical protein